MKLVQMSLRIKSLLLIGGFLALVVVRLFHDSFFEKQNHIEIYTLKTCGYCIMAKKLLDEKAIIYQEHDVAQGQEVFDEMLRRTHKRTVPQIIINQKSIGGYTELFQLNEKGQLDELLNL